MTGRCIAGSGKQGNAMKLVKIIIGLAAGVYAAFQVRQLTQLLQEEQTSVGLFGCIAGLCLGAALCIYLLTSAFKRAKSSS